MRIVIDPGTYNLLNMGGVAMFQVLVGRLRSMWPEAELHALTDDPVLLEKYCPGVRPIAHASLRNWTGDRYLLGRLHDLLPGPVSRRLVDLKVRLSGERPALAGKATLMRAKLTGHDASELESFLDTMACADMVVISGGSGFNDSFPAGVRLTCMMLEIASTRGIPTAIFSQGLGPMSERRTLRARAARVLPRVGLIAVRERLESLPLLRSFGVSADRIRVTGDDAIELACNGHTPPLGDGIGVNLRVAHYTSVDADVVESMRGALQKAARERAAPLLPMPITLHQAAPDHEVIRTLLAGYDDESDGGATLDTPLGVIAQAARCRVVVTGAYHAAVFALSQGVPVVAVAQSELYVQKFAGLADQFGGGGGCTTVRPGSASFPAELESAIASAWDASPQLRAPLRKAAAEQVALAREAYDHFHELAGRVARV